MREEYGSKCSHRPSLKKTLFPLLSPFSPSYVFSYLRRMLPEETVNEVRRMSLLLDGTGAVFDVPVERVEEFTAGTWSHTSI